MQGYLVFKAFIDAVEKIAFEMKPPNPYTPRLVQLCVEARSFCAPTEAERRYSPPVCTGAIKETVTGFPDESKVSTSHVERQNLTMRMSMRRFTRLTNGFSKKVQNHARAIGLHYMHYNFGRIHKSLRVTPAMQAGVSDHVWTLEEIAELAA